MCSETSTLGVKKLKSILIKKIKLEQDISPVLFLWDNLELVNEKIFSLSQEILIELNIPKINIFKLEDNWKIIKLEEIKQFLKISDTKTPYKIQILLIENFSRANQHSQNSCLKKLEEPWIKNLYFLTNKSESWILETILSRVQTVNLALQLVDIKNDFFYNLLEESIKNKNPKNLVSYFFKTKLEKTDYISFLETLIKYSKENFIFIDYLEEIFDDLNMIQTNNLLPKVTIDKWILRILNDLA